MSQSFARVREAEDGEAETTEKVSEDVEQTVSAKANTSER